MNNLLNKGQLTAIAVTCNQLHISKEAKAVMVAGFSDGRCTSSKDLYSNEARDMLLHLETLKPVDHSRNKMIGKILYYAHEMGWTKTNRDNKVVADGKRVDNWMLSHSYLKKKLNQYTYNELPKLVSQFEQVYKSFLSKF